MRDLTRLQAEINRRYDRLAVTDAQTMDHQVALTCDWIRKRPELRAVLAEAEQHERGLDFEMWRKNLMDSEEFTWWPSRTESGRAWLVWQLMNHVAAGEDDEDGVTYQVRDYSKPFADWSNRRLGVKAQNNDQVQTFVKQIFGPFFHYLSDQIDLGSAVVHVLQRYKTRVEWYDHKELDRRYREVTDAHGVGEDVYDDDLQRFLFLDGGYITYAKARVARGEPDLVGALNTDDPLICEGKLYVDDGRGRSHLANGFSQVIKAAHKYNKTVAYLVVFNLTEKLLRVHMDGPAGAWARYIEDAGIRVHIIVVNALPPDRPDSKAGKTKIVEISREDLVAGELGPDSMPQILPSE